MKALLVGLVLCASAAHAEKTFVYCSEAGPSTFNPQLADDGPTFNASSSMLYNRLIEFEDGTTKLIPALAESWTISKDGKTYTFKLRKNVAFHTTDTFKPTRAFNADDVLFTFDRALKKDHPFHKVGGGNYIYYIGMGFDSGIKSITKVDDHTVKFVLNQANAPFLANLAMSFAVMLSKEYGDQLLKAGRPEKMDSEPVGTGPFVLKRYVKDNSIRYEAHPAYFAGRSKLDKVVFAITPDANVRFQKLKAGECHLIAEPSPQDLKGIEAAANLKLMSQPGANLGYLALNTEKPPFNKSEVRQAVAHALNRGNYLQVVYQGTATEANGPIPPTVWGADPKIRTYDFNIEKAKALLKKAGFENGFEAELWTLPVSRPYNPNGKKMGELMQADLAKVGIKVKLVTYDWPTYLAKARKGDHQMLQVGWTTDNGDPDNFMGTLLSCASISSGGNMSRWCDKAYDKLVTKAREVSEVKARTALYFKAQDIVAKQSPWVPLANATVFRGLAKNVEGYKINPLGTEEFYPLDLK
ncbi:MAG: ABC transporter substrate-binding protein [Bdellovibrionales bacterium]|nr:ABC transporter substrate-binding protein [Bdellovibrionales bacterium]